MNNVALQLIRSACHIHFVWLRCLTRVSVNISHIRLQLKLCYCELKVADSPIVNHVTFHFFLYNCDNSVMNLQIIIFVARFNIFVISSPGLSMLISTDSTQHYLSAPFPITVSGINFVSIVSIFVNKVSPVLLIVLC